MTTFLTPAEFAERIHLTGVKDGPRWVKIRCRRREITHVRPSRNVFLIDPREVDRWIAKHTVPSVEPEPPVETPAVVEAGAVITGLSAHSRRKKLTDTKAPTAQHVPQSQPAAM